jgi:UDP-N-acetylglucosamine 2-epimerase (non-hydrolysing)
MLAERYPSVLFTVPVHPNPTVHRAVTAALSDRPRVRLVDPLDYPDLVDALRRSRIVLTDSGGIQEEAPTFGTPVLVLREVTERPEGVDAGAARLVGTDTDTIVSEARRLLDDPAAWASMSHSGNPYGDGHAAERIAGALAGRAVAPWDPDGAPRAAALLESAGH